MGNRYILNLDEIKSQLDPVLVLELIQRGKIKHHGNELRAPCPVHGGAGEENFSLNITNHNWCCHSQGCKGTNLIDLYAQSKKIKINEAAEALARQFGLVVHYKEPEGHNQNSSYSPESVLTCWNEAKLQGKDIYFKRKGLTPPPIVRYGKNPYNFPSMLVPLKDIEGDFKGFMCLQENHAKFNFKYKDIKGAFAQLGAINPEGEFYAGEGIATVQTAWEATQRKIPAISCGGWHNILPVITAVKGKYPNSKPIILIDCDVGGNGLKAAQMVSAKIPDATFRKPSFELFSNPKNEELTDFNDIISKRGQELDEVRRQLGIDFKLPISTDDPKTEGQSIIPHTEEINPFYGRLGNLIKDPKFSLQLNERTYDVFEQEHKRLFSSGGLIIGYPKIDEQLYFAKGDLVIVQAMSNHGKSTFMLQMAYRFLEVMENQDKDPMCVFVTYESTPIRVEEKLVNLIGHNCGGEPLILYSRKSEEKYLYPDRKDYQVAIAMYNNILKQNRMHILKSTPIEKLKYMVDLYKSQFPERTLILFLDYFQIIHTESANIGWERIKEMAYQLEALAIEKEVIIISASQVNENRQAREGRDIYNAATTMIDILNHSHVSLKNNKDHEKLYKPQVDRKNVCTFMATKQKHGSSFDLTDYLLFNGYCFEVNGCNNANTKNFKL